MTFAMTSISPSHANSDAQRIAVESWLAHGYPVVSMNTPDECEVLAPLYPSVEFVICHRTGKSIYKAPYALINAFIDYARMQQYPHAVIFNSDISIDDPEAVLPAYLERSNDGLVFANRHDHNGDMQNPTRYPHGFDVFVISSNHFDLLPQSMFAMGQTWWDYWIPYRFIRAGVPVQLVKEPIFLHHRHAIQYDQKEWERMTEHFVWMEKYGKQPYISNGRNAQSVTNEVYKTIMKHAR